MKVTKGGRFTGLVSNVVASGVTVSDPGGVFGGEPLTLQEVIDLIAAGTAPDIYYLNTLGGKDVLQNFGSLGATATVDLVNASVFLGVLTQNCTIGTTGWTTGRRCTIGVSLTENGTGGWTPTFTGVTWLGGTPVWTTTASTITHVVLFSDDGGATIYGAVVGGTPAVTAATISALGFVGPILISDTPLGSPLVFADLLQNEAGTDLLYADL